MATISKAFSGYLTEFLSGSGLYIPDWAVILALFASLAFVTFRGMQESSALNILCTTLEVSGLLLVILFSVLFLTGGGTVVSAPGSSSLANGSAIGAAAILQGAALAFYAFIGFEDIVNVAEEVKDPERNVPRAIVLSLAIAGTLYILVSWLATRVLDPVALANSKAPLLDVIYRAQPNFPRAAFTLIALFAVLNTALLNFVTASRLLFGMSREGLLPAWVRKLHPERATPHRAILMILPIVIFLALAGTLGGLAGGTATLILVMFCLVNLSLLVIKRQEPEAGSFQVPIFIPALALISNLVLVAFASQGSYVLALTFTAIGIALILIQNTLQKGRSSSV
jgi:amino acid transporter